jgi:alpha-galactosidase
MAGGALAIAIVDIGDTRFSTHPFHLNLRKLGLAGTQTGKNLWTGTTMELTDNMPLEIVSHDVLLLRVDTPKVRVPENVTF